MKFENTKDIKMFIEEMLDFFNSLSDEEEHLNKELFRCNGIQDDLPHEIELADLNAIEIMKVAKDLKKNRLERRKIKNNLMLIGTLKLFNKRFVEKGILADATQLIKNIDMHEKALEERGYTPRVLDNLKCAKKHN